MTWFRYKKIPHPDSELRQDYFKRCGITHENDMTAEEAEEFNTPPTQDRTAVGTFEIEFAE
jgi:hypothetical protein